jgi:RNA polymerase sigma-70 factor (ECF subfamily)
MMDGLAEFVALMDRAKTGCPTARRELYEQFGGAVLRVVRHKLQKRLRSIYDSRDFTQDVWASFFGLAAEDYRFAGPDELIDFLSTVAANKVADGFRRTMQGSGAKSNREAYLDEIAEPGNDHPTPSQFAIADEQWRRLLAGQSPAMRQVLDLLREGYTYEEVASRTGLHLKAIQRQVKRLTKRL